MWAEFTNIGFTSASTPNTSYHHANDPSHNTLANEQNLRLELRVGRTRHEGLKKALWDAYSVEDFCKGGFRRAETLSPSTVLVRFFK
jgi:hypothetical protein